MKIVISIVVFFFSTYTYAQQCNCDGDSILKRSISCRPTYFKNHTKLYRQFNCDSSWLTFENRRGIKKSIYSLEAGLMDYTERVGYQYATEFKTTFLIQNNVISGCCTPPEFILFNKTSGEKIKNFGPLIFYSENIKYPFVIYINDDALNLLSFYDVNTKKVFTIVLPKNKLLGTIKNRSEMYPEHLFEEPQITGNRFLVSFRYQNAGKSDNWHNYKVVVDLKKYGYR